MRYLGVVGIYLIGLLSVWLAYDVGIKYGVRSAFGFAFGILSFLSMSLCLLLATRIRVLEPFFGGLDRMYVVHKWLGVIAIATMLLHEQFHPRLKKFIVKTDIGHLAKEMGEWVYYPLLALVFISFFKVLPLIKWEMPYQFWRFTHRFIGVAFVMIVFHALVIDLPFAITSTPLMQLTVVFGVIGIVSYIYAELWAPSSRPLRYRITSLEHKKGVTDITLAPEASAIRWKAGQFAFFSAPESGLKEPHPFTIASAPQASSGELRVCIKQLGDWTRQLPQQMRVGDVMLVEGGYGRFDYTRGRHQQLWLAGGVGITPFLAWINAMQPTENKHIHLIYAVRDAREACGLDALQHADQQLPHFTYELYLSDEKGRLTAEYLTQHVPLVLKESDVYFCGPKGLRVNVLDKLKMLGHAPRSIHFEMFELR